MKRSVKLTKTSIKVIDELGLVYKVDNGFIKFDMSKSEYKCLVSLIEEMQPKNQCQGCISGWKTKELGDLFDKDFKHIYHVVQGGYKSELVACTKHLYEE